MYCNVGVYDSKDLTFRDLESWGGKFRDGDIIVKATVDLIKKNE